MITTEKLVKFLTDPEYDWEVVSPRGKTNGILSPNTRLL